MSDALIGRSEELGALIAELGGERRLVTISGAAGIGKSRLARALAQTSRASRGPDELAAVLWCSLGDAESPIAIADRIAAVLGSAADRDRAGDPVAAVGHALRARGPVLLVLDDFDRVTAASSATVARLLELAPELQLLVTSRERLGLAGELVYELGPPADSVELFLAAVRRVRPDFAPNETELGYVRRIVLELDENPLAMELAAPRLSVMGARALLHRLQSRFDVLRRGEGRHGSLEAAIDASWLALTPDEQSALAQASVFVGSFALDGAEAVIALPAASNVLDVVQALRLKSLLSAHELDGEVRLSLARSIRQFAALRLTPELSRAAEARHAEHYASMSEAWIAAGDRARLLAERDNVLGVAQRVLSLRAVNATAATAALRALLALEPVLAAGAPIDAFVSLVSPVVEATAGSGADPRLIARALLLRGALRIRAGSARAGAEDLVRALAMARSLADASLTSRALFSLGKALAAEGDHASAREHFARAEELFRRTGEASEEARVVACRAASMARTGETATAVALLERARAAHRIAGDRLAEAEDSRALVELRLDLGELAAAERELTESAALSSALGDRPGAAWEGVLGGLIHHLRGDTERARAAYTSSAHELARLGLRGAEAAAWGFLGLLCHAEGKLAEAHALLAQALRALESGGDRELSALFAAAGEALESPRAPAEIEPGHGSYRTRLLSSAREAARLRQDAAPPPPDAALVVERRARWFRAPHGERVALERRRPLMLLLERLAMARSADPGRALGWDALLEAGWPGERVQAEAAAHRVRVAISTLRKLGLQGALVTSAEGYLLSPEIPCAIVD